MCRKYGKIYLVEVIDFQLEIRKNSTRKITRLLAPLAEMKCKWEVFHAPYVLYITQRILQERYPSSGKTLGCSDVMLQNMDDYVLQNHIKYAAGGGIRP